ncbi:hypothetical protein HOD38_00685 [archaeon]|mgnify:CR=1 FL=1|jgi:hypothetical protein|nr:hypothetical protein [archaeon]MBT4396761.1 hypothetical protein [archaeon]MBT4441371.1 hypothetical protein [archaeon]
MNRAFYGFDRVDTGVKLYRNIPFRPPEEVVRQSSLIAGAVLARWRSQGYQIDKPEILEIPSGLEHLVL